MFVGSAPAKIIISGEHSVVHGHPAVATAIDLRSYAKIQIKNDDIIRLKIVSSKFKSNESKVFKQSRSKLNKYFKEAVLFDKNLEDLSNDEQKSLLKLIKKFDEENCEIVLQSNFNKNNVNLKEDEVCSSVFNSNDVLEKIFQQSRILFLFVYMLFTKAKVSLSCTILSQIPTASGLGSSAAFSASLSAAFIAQEKDWCYKIKNANISDKNRTLSEDDKHRLNQIVFKTEQVIHGRPSGIDNLTSVFGGTVLFQHNQETLQLSTNSKCFRILAINTNVKRNTGKLVQDVYNLTKNLPEISSEIFKSCGLVAKRVFKILEANSTNNSNEVERLKELNSLIRINQCLLDAISVSHPAIDQIVNLCSQHSVTAKLTGSGGGGFVIAFIEELKEEQINSLINLLGENGFNDNFLLNINQKGLLVHSNIDKDCDFNMIENLLSMIDY